MADTVVTSGQVGEVSEKRGLKDRIGGFFTNVSKEMKKVTWPSRAALQEATMVTIVLCIIFSLFVFGVDKVFEIVLRLIYNI
jgi:preprotein translocase subunit SecE